MSKTIKQSMMGDEKYVIKTPSLGYTPDSRGLGYVYFDCLKKHNNLVAQVDGATGKFETFATLLQDSVNTAVELQKRGVTRADIIGICSYNQLDSVKPFIAGQFLGCKLASFDPTLSLEDTIHLMTQVTPRIIFVSDNGVELVRKAIKEIGAATEVVIFGEEGGFSEFLKPKPESKSFKPVELQSADETAVIVFSSGTTGTPKGICLTHFGISGQAFLTNEALAQKGIKRKLVFEGKEAIAVDPTMSFASLYWVSSILFLTCNIFDGFVRVVAKCFDARLAWEYLERYRVGTMFVAPCQMLDMLAVKPVRVDTSYLEAILIGGSNVSEEQILRARKEFPHSIVIQGCGQTEVSGCYTFFQRCNPKDVELLTKNPKSCGRPVRGFTLKVVDPDTQELLGPYKPGELRVKTSLQMKGYYKIDSSSAWDAQGFINTGDILYYDEDFCFYHVDRIKEMLKYKSWHVAPASLEAILHTHPSVQNAVVVGLPHPEDGDHPLAFVVLKKGASISSEALLRYVNDQVDDRHKLRGGLIFVDDFPLTPTGKIKRRELRDMAVAIKSM